MERVGYRALLDESYQVRTNDEYLTSTVIHIMDAFAELKAKTTSPTKSGKPPQRMNLPNVGQLRSIKNQAKFARAA